jgi:hypothetical protein
MKKMKNVLQHHDHSSSQSTIDVDDDVPESPASLAGHQDLDNWV